MIYRAVTSENFYYSDIKRIARALVKAGEVEDLKQFVEDKHLIEYDTVHNFNKKFRTAKKRLAVLDSFLLNKLANAGSDMGKFIILFSILLNERLFLEFMDEVIQERYSSYEYYVYESEFIGFIREKAELHEEVAKWSEASKKKMAVKLKNFFREGGYLTQDEKGYKITRPIISLDILNHIADSEYRKILKTMLY